MRNVDSENEFHVDFGCRGQGTEGGWRPEIPREGGSGREEAAQQRCGRKGRAPEEACARTETHGLLLVRPRPRIHVSLGDFVVAAKRRMDA
ncbi:hypothetical protein SL003B_3695 [Polymorphum gilvum SL003B-26A1]|uniref:Uncharacterized protein n=1 Tax=Polymorphum gilvum (strain LMG 25793 / CGMCC 1.9160 / SL003B-26A1) TaxID=991905 RepID=F2J2U1_POLGS|nr:hypothetical protein SL003B_3695 [Polymorphum gilvum SL003B-26A1]